MVQVITCRVDLLVPANPVILDGVADLTGLTYLNEPSILHGLNLRYSEDLIYTHAGPVLIAINPFKQVNTGPNAWYGYITPGMPCNTCAVLCLPWHWNSLCRCKEDTV